jgi:hypothetical protein
VNTVILVLLVLDGIEGANMAFGEMWFELAKQRAEDLREEGCRSRRFRRSASSTRPAAVAGRVGCLPAEGSA